MITSNPSNSVQTVSLLFPEVKDGNGDAAFEGFSEILDNLIDSGLSKSSSKDDSELNTVMAGEIFANITVNQNIMPTNENSQDTNQVKIETIIPKTLEDVDLINTPADSKLTQVDKLVTGEVENSAQDVVSEGVFVLPDRLSGETGSDDSIKDKVLSGSTNNRIDIDNPADVNMSSVVGPKDSINTSIVVELKDSVNTSNPIEVNASVNIESAVVPSSGTDTTVEINDSIDTGSTVKVNKNIKSGFSISDGDIVQPLNDDFSGDIKSFKVTNGSLENSLGKDVNNVMPSEEDVDSRKTSDIPKTVILENNADRANLELSTKLNNQTNVGSLGRPGTSIIPEKAAKVLNTMEIDANATESQVESEKSNLESLNIDNPILQAETPKAKSGKALSNEAVLVDETNLETGKLEKATLHKETKVSSVADKPNIDNEGSSIDKVGLNKVEGSVGNSASETAFDLEYSSTRDSSSLEGTVKDSSTQVFSNFNVSAAKLLDLTNVDNKASEISKVIENNIVQNVEQNPISNISREMVMKLQPEDLGTIVIRMQTTDNGLKVKIMASNAEVNSVLNAQIVQMENVIKNQGVNLNSINIEYSGLLNNNGGFEGRRQQEFTNGSTKDSEKEYKQFMTVGAIDNKETESSLYSINSSVEYIA